MAKRSRDFVDGPACLCDYNRPVDDVDSMLLSSEWDIDVLVDDACDNRAYDNEPDVDQNARNKFNYDLDVRIELSHLSPSPGWPTHALFLLREVV